MSQISKERFNHNLRLIFTYYASQGNKEDPLMLRQKNFEKFLRDSTISELINIQNKSFLSSGNQNPKRKELKKNKALQVLVNTFSKPIHYEQFRKIITDVLFQVRHVKNEEDIFEQLETQNDLFSMCQEDPVVSEIFSFLYEQIKQCTPLGQIIGFSQNKSLYDQEGFTVMRKHHKILKVIYFHYFDGTIKSQRLEVDGILNALKKFVHQFEISPQNLSLTQIFVILWEVIESRSRSVYEQQFQKGVCKSEQLEGKEWEQFSFISFVKVLLLIAQLISLRQKDNSKSDYKTLTVMDFLESLAITKGYRNVKSLYKIDESFFIQSSQKSIKNNGISSNSFSSREKQYIKLMFEPKPVTVSKASEILGVFDEILRMIFLSYSSKDKELLMSYKQFQFFCSEFKITSQLVSKKEIEQIYRRIFYERQFFNLQGLSDNPHTKKHHQSTAEKAKIIEQNQLKMYGLVQRPQFGLNYLEFKKVLLFGSQSENVCLKFTHCERLLYWLQHILGQKKTKTLIQRENTRMRTNVIASNDVNLIAFISTLSKDGDLKSLIRQEFESMYKKLKRSTN